MINHNKLLCELLLNCFCRVFLFFPHERHIYHRKDSISRLRARQVTVRNDEVVLYHSELLPLALKTFHDTLLFFGWGTLACKFFNELLGLFVLGLRTSIAFISEHSSPEYNNSHS